MVIPLKFRTVAMVITTSSLTRVKPVESEERCFGLEDQDLMCMATQNLKLVPIESQGSFRNSDNQPVIVVKQTAVR